jgi:hypothetical protein
MATGSARFNNLLGRAARDIAGHRFAMRNMGAIAEGRFGQRTKGRSRRPGNDHTSPVIDTDPMISTDWRPLVGCGGTSLRRRKCARRQAYEEARKMQKGVTEFAGMTKSGELRT